MVNDPREPSDANFSLGSDGTLGSCRVNDGADIGDYRERPRRSATNSRERFVDRFELGK